MGLKKLAPLFLALSATLFAARFGIDHIGRIVRLADPQIAPDGKSIALVVSRTNYEEDRYDPELVLIDVTTHNQRTLTRDRRGVSQARWSPDGSRLAFLATVDTRPQIFVLPMSGGDAWQVTRSPTGIQQYAWRPGGSNEIAYVASDEAPKVTGEERHNRAFEIQNNHFLLQEAPRPAHVWLIAADGKSTARRLTSGAWTLPVSLPPGAPSSPLSWSPDGKLLAIVKVASPYTGDGDKAAVQLLDVDSGNVRPLTGRTRNESQPVFSPDGSRIAHWYPRDGENRNVNEIHIGPANGGDTASITRALDRNVQRVIWMPGGKSMLVSANDGTTTGLWIQPLEGAARRIDMGKVVATAGFWLDASVGPKGEIALTGSEPERPAELYYIASPDSSVERLSDYNRETATLDLGRSETVQWDSTASTWMAWSPTRPASPRGRSIPWCSTFTAARGRRPSRPSLPGRSCSPHKAGSSSNPTINYRGSDNLGNTFQAGIWNDAGAGPGRDVMAGVATLEKRGFVDSAKMGVSGWSYGGYMTTWLLGNYSEKWKAAVAGAAVTDWLDQYNYGDANVRRGSAFGGSPYTDAKRMQAYREQSPIYDASKIQAPTLILSDTGDFRVPITQSFQLYHALVDNGVPAQFIAYSVTGHSPSDPIHSRDIDRRWIAWLGKYLAP